MHLRGTYHYYGYYQLPLLYCWTFQKWAWNSLGEPYGLPSNLSGNLLYLNGHLLIDQADWDEIIRLTHQAVETDNYALFEGLCAVFASTTEAQLQASSAVTMSRATDATAWQAFSLTMRQMEYPWFFVLPLSDALEEAVQRKIVALNLSGNLIDLFFTSSRPTPYLVMQDSLAAIRSQLDAQALNALREKETEAAFRYIEREQPAVYHQIVEHLSQFAWFGMMHLWGTPYSKEAFVQDILRDPPVTVLPREDIPLALQPLAQIVRELAYWRTFVAEACGIGSYQVRAALLVAAEHLGLTHAQVLYLTFAEFIAALEGQGVPDEAELAKRQQGYSLLMEQEPATLVVDEEVTAQLIQQYVPQRDTTETEVRGRCAYRGIVRGRVQLVFTPEDIHKVRAGDILVASETTPDFLPAMRHATAIVTDQGGITSHAAIVSRELRIPCVVGTQRATLVFASGDMVEVNAETGVVRHATEAASSPSA